MNVQYPLFNINPRYPPNPKVPLTVLVAEPPAGAAEPVPPVAGVPGVVVAAGVAAALPGGRVAGGGFTGDAAIGCGNTCPIEGATINPIRSTIHVFRFFMNGVIHYITIFEYCKNRERL